MVGGKEGVGGNEGAEMKEGLRWAERPSPILFPPPSSHPSPEGEEYCSKQAILRSDNNHTHFSLAQVPHKCGTASYRMLRAW